MVGRLDDCVLLAYLTPAAAVQDLLPPALELMTRDGSAFWNVVACRIDRMRPRGLPRAVGVSYLHVAYRLYVRARVADGQTIDGLYFIRSDVDSAALACCGNFLTDFRFHRAAIDLAGDGDAITLNVRSPDGANAWFHAHPTDRAQEDHEFLNYRPIALSCDGAARWLRLAEVARDESAWYESPLDVIEAKWTFLERLGQTDLRLVAATRVAPIDYAWKLGRRLPLVARGGGQSTSTAASASFPPCSTTSGRG